MDAEWFAGRLRELRESRGLSREQLAKAAGLKIGGVRDLEQGLHSPAWKTVIALCHALEVTPDAFTTQPADRPPATVGRPRKAVPAEMVTKKPRGRPRKAK